VINETNTKLNMIYDSCKKKNLTINLNKTKYMIIKGKKLDTSEIKISINNNMIERVNEYKYLGVIIDDKLNWKKHQKYINKKLKYLVTLLYRLRYYIPLNYLLHIIKTNIITIITYSIEIYGNKTNIIKLDKYLKKIINIVTYNKNNNDNKIKELYKCYKIRSIYEIYRYKMLTLTHNMIHNDVNIPIYFRNKLKLKYNRKGLYIKTEYRKNNYSNNILINKLHDLWNELPINTRNINELSTFQTKLIANTDIRP
jgi:hypothetical protein